MPWFTLHKKDPSFLSMKSLPEPIQKAASQAKVKYHEGMKTANVMLKESKKKTAELFAETHKMAAEFNPLSLANQSFETVKLLEMGFNAGACLPFLGFYAASLRIIAGKVQLVAGAVLMGIGEAGLFSAKFHNKAKAAAAMLTWNKVIQLGKEHALHGGLNTLRGYGELAVSTLTLGFGNVLLLVPNLSTKQPFTPIFPYTAENIEKAT